MHSAGCSQESSSTSCSQESASTEGLQEYSSTSSSESAPSTDSSQESTYTDILELEPVILPSCSNFQSPDPSSLSEPDTLPPASENVL